jgi:photosystem II stability/assembly factor-like uncharacterized protein
MVTRTNIWLAFLLTPASINAGTNVWTSHGPGGGNVQSVAIDPVISTTVYVGTSGGVFKSTDDGTTWTAASSGLVPGSAYTIAIDPLKPSTLYAWNGKFFKSTDGAQSWIMLATLGRGAYAVAIDPQNEGTLYAANGDGVYKSTDGGGIWTDANSGLAGLAVRTLEIDPQDPNTLYAGIGSFNGGVFLSRDGGASWSSPLVDRLIQVGHSATHACDDWGFYFFQITGRAAPAPEDISCFVDGNRSAAITAAQYISDVLTFVARHPNGPDYGVIVGVSTLVVDPQTQGTVYASTNTGVNTGVFISTDGAITWTVASSGLRRFDPVNAIAVDPNNPGTLYASTYATLYKSTDGTRTWNAVVNGLPPIVSVAVNPQNSNAVYAATNSGLYKSEDGGASWGSRNNGMANSYVVSMLVSSKDRGTLYAGTFGVPFFRWFRSIDAGASWINTGLSGSNILAIDPQNPDTIYANGGLGGPTPVLQKSTDGGVTWQPTGLKPPPAHLVVDPTNSNTLYASGAGLFKSTDGGATWSQSDYGIGGTATGAASLESLTIDPQHSNTLYAALYGKGQILKTTDGAASWNPVSLGDAAGLFHIYSLIADPQNSGTVYAAFTAFDCGYYDVCPMNYFDKLSAGPGPGLYKTTDGGQSWSKLDKLPLAAQFSGVNALAIDPKNSNILYAAPTDVAAGVFRSTDGGASWSALRDGLTTPFVSVLAVDTQDSSIVYAGTEGGGVFAITIQ